MQHVAGTKRHHDRRVVVARIAVGAVAADGAAVTHLRIGDLRRGFRQDRAFLGKQVGAQHLVLGRAGADHDRIAVFADAAQTVDAVDIDEMRRLGQAQFHHRYQTVAAGQHLAVVAELDKQRQNFIDRVRAMILERSRRHDFPP